MYVGYPLAILYRAAVCRRSSTIQVSLVNNVFVCVCVGGGGGGKIIIY